MGQKENGAVTPKRGGQKSERPPKKKKVGETQGGKEKKKGPSPGTPRKKGLTLKITQGRTRKSVKKRPPNTREVENERGIGKNITK